jgi:signal recognition particle receptor subunit beta
MVRSADHKVFIKILYWGIAGSGGTTIVDTLHRVSKKNTEIKPYQSHWALGLYTGSTLYFDRGIFVSTKQQSRGKVFYHVYTVAGQRRFSPLRKKIFDGTDGIIFVVDSQTKWFEDNIESLKELKNIAQGRLIKEIPLVIMLNKQDLSDVIGEEDFRQVLKDEELWYDPDHELFSCNPIIYKTCALYHKKQNVYSSFYECTRQIENTTNFQSLRTYSKAEYENSLNRFYPERKSDWKRKIVR